MDSLYDQFQIVADLYPEKTALLFKGETLSFAQLKKEVELFSEKLYFSGVKPMDLVVVEIERSPLYLIALFALIRLKAVFLPLDPKLPESRKNLIKQESQAPFIVTSNGLSQQTTNPPKLPDGAFYVMYTSGSSGHPKGVIGSQEGLINRIRWMQETYPIDSTETHLFKTALSFVDHLAESFQALLSGASLVILPDNEVSNIELFLEEIHHHQISRMVVVPSFLNILLQMSKSKLLASHLRFLFSSGEALPISLAEKCAQLFPQTRLINIYGSTEVSADATFYEFEGAAEKHIQTLFHKKSSPLFTQTDIPLEQLFSHFLPHPLPHSGTPSDYQTYFSKNILPYSVDVSHPKFIGHMTSGLPDFMGELSQLVTMLNQNTVKIETAKALILLEKKVLATLHRLFYQLPASFYQQHTQGADSCLGLILSGGTLANIQALHIAKFQALLKAGGSLSSLKKEGFYSELYRLGYKRAVILGSSLMHYSIKKALSLLGMGEEGLISVNTNASHQMDLEDLQEKIDLCKRDRSLILAIVGIAGTTELGTLDPLLSLAEIAEREKLFFHVDAAWGGPLIFSDLHKHKLKGIEKADSITICGHKQLYTPLGTSLLLLKDPYSASATAVHARYQAAQGSYDLGQFSLLGSKPAQAVFLDAALQIYGKAGYQYLINKGCQLAKTFANLIQSIPAFELISPPETNILAYRYIPPAYRDGLSDPVAITQATRTLQQTQFLKGSSFLSYTTLSFDNHSIGVFRAVFANPLTTEEDLYAVLEEQLALAKNLFEDPIEIPLFSKTHNKTIPIGYPLSNTTLFLLDSSLNPVSPGEIGQIHIGGSPLCLGYLNAPSTSFVTYKDQILYQTGDYGRLLASGALEYLGRQDQQVKVRGSRIDLLEVEEHLFSIASQACALVLEGELIAFYTANKTPLEIAAHLRQRLPEYMIPSQYFPLSQFPLLPNGKIDRQSLYQLGVQNQVQSESISTPYEKVSSLTQSLLRQSQPDPKTNFFDLGFTSLSIHLLLLKLQTHYPHLKLTDLYAYSTIEQLSHFLETGSSLSTTYLDRRKRILGKRKSALRAFAKG